MDIGISTDMTISVLWVINKKNPYNTNIVIIILITRPGAHTTKYNYHGANY